MDVAVALVGGEVVDPLGRAIYPADIGVDGGRIVAIDRERGHLNAERSVDVSGMLVCPGFVDLHAHVYQHVSRGSLDPDDIGIRQGVCAVVDTGSFGPGNAAGFYEYVVRRATTRVYGLVNISRHGNSTNPGEGEVLGFLNPADAVRTIGSSGAWLRGVKVRASVTAAGLLGAMSTRLGKQAAAEAGVPLMVHIGNAPPTLDEVCENLTRGDIITHCFHGKVGGILTSRHEIRPSVKAALERGVLLDVGHGSASFAWNTAEQALSLGFTPHSISTDLHRGCINGPVYSLVKTLSKMMHLGMDLLDVVHAASPAPAHALGLEEEFGRIAEGAPANLSVVELVEQPEEMFDTERQSRLVARQLEARYTVLDGVLHAAQEMPVSSR